MIYTGNGHRNVLVHDANVTLDIQKLKDISLGREYQYCGFDFHKWPEPMLAHKNKIIINVNYSFGVALISIN